MSRKNKPGFSRRRILISVFVSAMVPLPSTMAHGQLSIYAKDFLRATYTPETLLVPAATGAISNYYFRPAGFGSGAEGMGNHYRVSLADNICGKFLRKFAFANPSHHQDYYRPLGSAVPVVHRLRNVLLHSLFADPQASHLFNWSSLPASLAAAALSNSYQPQQQRTLGATFQRFGTNAAGYLASDFISEITFRPKPNIALRLVISPQ